MMNWPKVIESLNRQGGALMQMSQTQLDADDKPGSLAACNSAGILFAMAIALTEGQSNGDRAVGTCIEFADADVVVKGCEVVKNRDGMLVMA
jgi:hypothetical protein